MHSSPPDADALTAFADDRPGSIGYATNTSPLLTPKEVGLLFRVDPKTVTRWAKAGKITATRTLGGHRRYQASEVRALLDSGRDVA